MAFVLLAAAQAPDFDPAKPFLARNPTLSADSIAFEFGTDLWTVSRDGGRARRLTVGPGVESNPRFSPDGQTVAFTGQYDGNFDVFIVPAKGGNPKRLTWHPGSDQVEGWTPDGKAILFSTGRDHPNGQSRLYTVPVDGGWPTALPLPRGNSGSLSADGSRVAYIPHDLWQPEWKRYRGGQTTPIWIARLSDSTVEKIPRENSQDRSPMFIGNSVYFNSDRNGRYTLYRYDTGSKQVTQVVPPDALDIKSASAGPGAIVFERMGSIHLYDLNSRAVKRVPITIQDDFLEVRPSIRNQPGPVSSYDVSPSAVRGVFESRGDIFTIPADKGDARNLTQTPGVAERSPIWSPDGKRIAYLTDESGNYKLKIVDSMDGGNPQVYDLSEYPNFYRAMSWSPDSKKILYSDQTLRLRILDIESKQSMVVDREPYYLFGDVLNPSWSPDSKWVVYTKRGKNKLGAAWVYSLESAKATQITDGLSDAQYAVFDRGGKYLYFLASTNIAETISLGGMSSMNHPVSYSAYVVVLNASDPSPFAPESDEEKIATPPPAGGGAPAGPPAQAPKPEVEVKIDFEGLDQRILSMPIPTANYVAAAAATPGTLILIRVGSLGEGPPVAVKFTMRERTASTWITGLGGLALTPKGDKALIQGPAGFQVVSTAAPYQPGPGAINLASMQARVDPRAEWRQMFYEVWRNMRDFLYDPNTHGLDINKVIARYEPYLANLTSRADYNYMMQDMLNEVGVGHTFSGGGEVPGAGFVPGGLLGADYTIENGLYRFAKVYTGENWNPGLRAPLTQPGAQVKAGEYLLAVNGKELEAKDNIYARFEATANKQVRLKVGPNPDGSGSREVTVVPVASEGALRYQAWVEGNRRKVDQLSGGKVSYIYMPDTSPPGFMSFNRYFLAQLDKDAVLVDDRFNGGGFLSDYVVQILSRKVLGNAAQRDHEDVAIPIFSNEGPKAMLINESAGSGGDALPWFFKTAGLGPLIGTQTWGGLVAAGQGVPLMGGGFATAPQVGIYGIKGEWEIEGHGIKPDIEVIEDPALWRQGRDPQLERAVEILLQELARNPKPVYKRPAFPNLHRNSGLGKGG